MIVKRKTMQTLNYRYDFAKRKHPNIGFEDLVVHMGKLSEELKKLSQPRESGVPDEYYQNRVIKESIDVAVVAARIAEGELW